MLESGVVGWFSKVWKWSHAGAVGTECEDTASCEEFHGFGTGIGVTGSQAIDDVGDVAMPFGKWAVIEIRISTMKEDDITESKATMLLFEAFNIGWLHKGADTVGGFIAKVLAVDDASFTAELPWLYNMGPGKSEGAGFFTFEFGTEDRVGRHVHLRACIAVHEQYVKVEGAVGTNWEFGDALEAREGSSGPGSGIVGGYEERTVDEPGCL